MKAQFFIEQNINENTVTNYHYWNTRINENTVLVELECGSISEAMSYVIESGNKLPLGTIIYRASEESSFRLEPILKVNGCEFELLPLPPKNDLYVLLYSLGGFGFSYIGDESKMEFIVGMSIDKLDKTDLDTAYHNYCFEIGSIDVDSFVNLAKSKNMLFDFYGTRLI